MSSTLIATSHGFAAGGYAVLALLLATRWRDRMRGSLLLIAVLCTVVWGLVSAMDPGTHVTRLKLCAELAKSGAWMLFLVRMLSVAAPPQPPLLLRGTPVVIAVVTAILGLAGGDVLLERAYVVGGLLLAICGFVLVEQVLRNTRASESWSYKFVWLGTGCLFAYDIALHSASYAVAGIEETLSAARGFAAACVLPLLGVGVARVRHFEPQRMMSQQLALYTGSVVAAGAYLVLVAFAAYYVRVLGSTWGAALQVVLVFAALVGLLALVFSATVRARLRVELAKHFFPYKYDYRTEWLDLTERLTRDHEGTSLAERTVEAFARLARSSGGGIWVMREGSLQPVAGVLVNAESPHEPADSAFCQFVESKEWIVDLDAARAASGRDDEVPLPEWLRNLSEAWLAIPLLHEQRLVGLVVLRHQLAQQQLSWEDLDLLRTAGRQAASYFALESAADALVRERQFAAFSRFSAFMMHDLSNILAQQRLIVDNAARHRHNPEFIDDAISTIENTVRRMSRLLDQMREGREDSAVRRTVLVDVAERAVRSRAERVPRPELVAEDLSVAVQVAPDRLENVLEHVIRNAQDATPPSGSVRVVVRSEAHEGVIEVVDTGAGMDAEFLRDRLFRPFDTTKGAKGMGIGAFQAREFVRAAGGDVRVASVPGSGTSFVIRLPRA